MANWRKIVGYRGIYEVSTEGRVRSIERVEQQSNRKVTLKERELKQTKDAKGGFLYVKLWDDVAKKHIKHRVHTLVAWAFIGFDRAKMILHKDGNRDNNHVDNLESLNKDDYMERNIALGVLQDRRGENRKSKPIIGEHVKTGDIKRYVSQEEAILAGFGSVWHSIHKGTTCKGYKFRLA